MVDSADLLTTAAVAELLSVTVRTVRAGCGSGKFPGATKHGRDWMIPDAAIDHYREFSLGSPGRKPGRPNDINTGEDK